MIEDPIAGGDGGLEPGQDPGQQPAATQYQPDTTYKFNPGNYGYTFRSSQVYPQSKEEMLELLQFGHSWRHNKPKFEQQQQEIQAKSQQYQKYQQLEEALNQSPEFAKKLWGLYEEHQQQPAQTQLQDITSHPEFTQVKQTVEQLQAATADRELATEMEKMMAAHQNINWNKDTGEGTPRMQLLRYMRDRRINDPEDAYWAMFGKHTVKQEQFATAGKTTQQIQQQHRDGIVSTGQPTPGQQAPKPAKNLNEALDNALAEIGAKQ